MNKNIIEQLQDTLEKEAQKKSGNRLIESYKKMKEAGLIVKTEYTFPMRDTLGNWEEYYPPGSTNLR